MTPSITSSRTWSKGHQLRWVQAETAFQRPRTVRVVITQTIRMQNKGRFWRLGLIFGLVAALIVLGLIAGQSKQFNRLIVASQDRGQRENLITFWGQPVRMCLAGDDEDSYPVLTEILSGISELDIETVITTGQTTTDCLQKSADIIYVRSDQITDTHFQDVRNELISQGAVNLVPTLPGSHGFTTFFGTHDGRTVALVWTLQNSPIDAFNAKIERLVLIQETFHALSFGVDIPIESSPRSILHEMSDEKGHRMGIVEQITSWYPNGLCRLDIMLLLYLYRDKEIGENGIQGRTLVKPSIWRGLYLKHRVNVLSRQPNLSSIMDDRC